MKELRRKLTAILSADVKGYSRLMGEDEKRTVRTLNEYKEVMTGLIEHHHGRVVDAPGDNVLAEFASMVGRGGAQLRPDTMQEPLRGRAMDFQFDEKKLRFVKRVLNNRLLFKIALLFQVPMNFMTGMRLRELSEESCKVSVPYRWLNKNPFKSTFWAVLGMAAEMSTGALVVMYTYKLDPSVSIIVGDCSGEFVAKARDLTTFVCNDGERIAETVRKAIKTREPQEVLCKTIGYSKAGEEVARFTFTWKMKIREA